MAQPNTVQNRFAFGTDNGSESGHSLDTENADRGVQAGDVTFLIRIQVEETNAKADIWTFQLFAQKNGAGGYTAVTATRTDGIRLADDTQSRVDNSVTTERLTAGAGAWLAGLYDDGQTQDGMGTALTLNGEYTDLEFAIEIDSGPAQNDDYWDLQVYSTGSVALDSYTVTPRVTADLVDPIEVTPAAVVAGADSVNPTVRFSSVSITPSVSAAGADSIIGSVDDDSVALPATVSTTSEIFAQYQNVGPFIDGNDNLYIVLRNTTNQHIVEMWKSSDGGGSWSEVDSAGHPLTGSAGTVTGIDVIQDGTMLHIACMDANEGVYYHSFTTSDHGTTPDEWVTVDKLVVDYTDSAFERSATIAIQPDGDLIIFSNGDDGTYFVGRECVEYHYSDDAGSTWTTKNALGDTDSDNIVGPTVIGENSKIHVMWKEEVNARWMHSSLVNIDSTPSASEDATAAYTVSGFNYTSAHKLVYYDDAGVERITFVALSNGTDTDVPYSTIINDDGTPDTAEQVTTTAVWRGSTNYHAAAMSLVVDKPNKTVYMVFADKTTQDIYLIKNVNDGGWVGETEIWDAVTADLLSINSYVIPNGDLVIGIVIDDGGPSGTIKYNEYVIRAASVGEVLHIDYEEEDKSDHDSEVGAAEWVVNAGAALVGSFGSVGTHDGAGTDFYGINSVEITTNTIRFRVYMEDVSLSMTAGDVWNLVNIKADATVSAIVDFVRLRVDNDVGTVKIFAAAKEDDDTTTNTDTANLPSGAFYAEVLCTRATSDVASNGTVELWIDGVSTGAAVTSLDNYDSFNTISGLWLGADSSDVGTSGDHRWDDFILRDDDTLIGSADADIDVTPAAVVAGADSIDPSVEQDSLGISPTLVAAGADSIDPSVQHGDINLSPTAVSVGADSIDPSVEQDSLNVSPSVVAASADSVAPSVQQDSLNISPSPASVATVVAAYDNFNRASIGSDWIDVDAVSGASIISNELSLMAGDKLVRVAEVFADDQFCEVKFVSSVGTWKGISVRNTGTDDTVDHTNFIAYFTPTSLRFGYQSGASWGAYLDIGTSITTSDGDIIRLEVTGQDEDIELFFYINGILQASHHWDNFTNQAIQYGSGTPGFYANSDGLLLDDWVGGPVTSAVVEITEGDVNVSPSAVAAGADSIDPSVEQDSLNISPTLVAAGADSVDPSVQQDSLNISPSAAVAGADSIDPTVEVGGDINVSPAASAAGADSIDPSVQQDSLNISPSAVAAGADSIDPSVEQDSLNVSPSAVAAGADSVDPTVELGDIGVTPTVGAASADSVDPTVRQDSLNVATTPVSSGADSIDPSVEQDSQNISPSVVAAGADSVDPSVEQDSLNISPTLVDAGADSVDPSVEQDSLNVSPTASSAGADSIDPTVDISGGGTNVWPTEVTSGADSVDPTIRLGSVSITPVISASGAGSIDPTVQNDIDLYPTETAAGADSIDPGVQVGSVGITPAVTESGADSVNPTVQVGDLSLSPALSDASAVGVDPTVQITGGDVNVSPAASVAGADSLVGEVRQGSISISPTLTDASAVSVNPTFQYSSVNVTPAVVAAGADSVDPTVDISLPPINITPSAASAATVAVVPSVTLSSVSVTPSAATAATATTIADVQEGEGVAPDPVGAGTDTSVVIVGGNNRLIISFARVLIPVGDNLQVFPDPAAAGADSVSPSLYFTSISVSPAAVSAGTDAVDPTVGFTDVDVTPSAAAASADTTGPTVFHSSVSSSPAPAAAGVDSVDPTFQYGSISTQALTDAIVGADSVGPIVTGGFTFTPTPASAGTDTVDPSVVHGDFSRTPEPVSAGTDVVDPALHWSSHSSTLAPASAGTVASIGEVATGGAQVTPVPASAATDVVDPDVLQIGMLVSTDPASAGTDAHLGSVVEGGGFLDIYPVENYTQAASRIGEVRIDPAAPEFPDPAVAETHTQGPTVQYTGGGVDIHPSSVYAQAAVSYKWFQVRLGSVGITPAPAAAGADTVLGEARQHTLWLAPWVKYAVASTTDPTIRFGSVSLWKPPAIAKTATTLGSVQNGSLDLAPAAATASTSVVDPTILIQGGYTAVSPALVAVRAVSINPTTQLGSISITPTPAAAGAAVAVGVVLQFSTVDVYPVALSAGTRVVGPRVSQLAMALYPAAVTASTDAPLPTVFLGPEEVTSYPVFARVNVTGPTVGLSGHSVTPGAAVAAASSIAPSIIYGSINVSPAVASAIVVSVGPEYLVLDNLYPELDVVIGTWTDKDEGTSDLFDSLDERPEPDDSDYIMNETPDGEVYRADMDEGVDPGRDDHHYVEYRISKDSPLSQIDLTVTLKEGVTVIATWIHVDIAIEPVTIKQTLTTLQASNIGNYSDLYLEFDAVEV